MTTKSTEELEDLAIRTRLDALIAQTPGESYASISALIGRNHAYIQQYIKRGQPRRLQEKDRRTIATHLNTPEYELGGPGSPHGRGFSDADPLLAYVPRYSRHHNTRNCLNSQELTDGDVPFRPQHLHSLTPTPPERLRILMVQGDAMYPTLSDGDEVLVDCDEHQPHRDAIYALQLEETLQIKRISVNPITGRLTIKSDNPLYESWSDCDPCHINILGRVIWAGRKL